MAVVNEEKEVDFKSWCAKCKHKDLPEDQDPCDECLENPTNLYSHVPVMFVEGETQNG